MTPIAELHWLQERVELAESQYRQLVDMVNTVIVCFTADRRITQWNREAERVFGWTYDEAIGRDCHELIGVDGDDERLNQAIAQVLTGSPIWSYQVRKRAKDGSERVLLCNLTSAEPPVGETEPRIVALGQDFTARAATESRLRESEQRFRLIAETIQDVFWMREPHTASLQYISPAYATIWGRSVDSLYADPRSFLDGIHPDDRDRVTADFAAHQNTGWETEYRVVRPDGTVRWVRDRGFPVFNQAGAVRMLTGAASDITELHERREEQQKTEEQLRVAQRLEPVGRLAGGVAHDFNNLLVVINGYAELALQGLRDSDPLRHDLEQIYEAGMRAATLTQQLLAFSRKQVRKPALLDLAQVVRSMEDMLHRLIGDDISLQTVFADDSQRVWADRGQVEQVIMNLVVNARDAMPQGGTIVLETRRREDRVELMVSDTGCGMDATTQQHMFEPFFTTKPDGEGTGLGLPTVYGIVEQSGGTIAAQSSPGEGTMFTISLPIDHAHHQDPALSVTPVAARGTETVLLVDDAGPVRQLTERILTKAGFSVLSAANGFQALELAARSKDPVDVLLTDVVMPQMSGCELAGRIRRQHPGMRVLYMSGYSGRWIADRDALDADAVLLEKPFSPAEVTRRIREALDSATAEIAH